MDAEFWIYLIIGVIYFLSRLLKKGPEVTGEASPPPQRGRKNPAAGPPEGDGARPMTFEELLREITEGKQIQRRQSQPKPVPAFEPFGTEAVEAPAKSVEAPRDEVASAPKWKSYEETPVGANERRSLEETLHLEDTVVDFRKFDAFERRDEKRISEDYIRLLRNPQSLKQAVVLSEILKTKF